MTMPLHGYPAPEGKPVYGADGRRIVYDENGKPCRTCNTLLDFQMVTGKKSMGNKAKSAAGAATVGTALTKHGYAKDQPPDVEKLGRSSWTFLHSVAATYPEKPNKEQQEEMRTFIRIFAKIYPCWFCAMDFQKYIKKSEPKVTNQEEFGRWLCDAHNAVNKKLGKPHFDCNLWKKRWKDGWDE